MMTGVARAAPRMIAFFDELKLQGFAERQNLKIVLDGFDLRDDQYAELATTLIKVAADAVFCVGDAATRAEGHPSHKKELGRPGCRGMVAALLSLIGMATPHAPTGFTLKRALAPLPRRSRWHLEQLQQLGDVDRDAPGLVINLSVHLLIPVAISPPRDGRN
jgi:hypothetical protein